MDSNVEIAAPVVGDIGSVVSALLEGMGDNWPAPPTEWTGKVREKVETNVAKMAPRLQEQQRADGLPRCARRTADCHHASDPTRSSSTRAPTRSISRAPSSTCTSRASVSTSAPGASWVSAWATAVAAAVETGKPVLAVDGDSAFGFSGMEIETICRYKLPVCVVVFNNNGIYRGTDVNPRRRGAGRTTFVKDADYDKMMEAFGGVGVHVTSPDELSRAVNEALSSGKPTLINAVIDEKAGTESGRIGNLNPQSAMGKKGLNGCKDD